MRVRTHKLEWLSCAAPLCDVCDGAMAREVDDVCLECWLERAVDVLRDGGAGLASIARYAVEAVLALREADEADPVNGWDELTTTVAGYRITARMDEDSDPEWIYRCSCGDEGLAADGEPCRHVSEAVRRGFSRFDAGEELEQLRAVQS